MVSIYNAGICVSISQNLRGMLEYGRNKNTFVTEVHLNTNDVTITVRWDNGSTCTTDFADYSIMYDFVYDRKRSPYWKNATVYVNTIFDGTI